MGVVGLELVGELGSASIGAVNASRLSTHTRQLYWLP